MKKILVHVSAVALLMTSASADVWDVQSDNDDGAGTDIDSTTGDIGAAGLDVDRRSADGVTVLQDSSPAVFGAGGYSRALRFQNTTATTVIETIRMGDGACGLGCGDDDVYDIRVRETTVSVARFNNFGSQTTVLLIQNSSNIPIAATVFLWNTAGALAVTIPVAILAPKALAVINTATVAAATRGSITIANTAPYGQLNVKSVALEPSTGFSFDTPGTYRGF